MYLAPPLLSRFSSYDFASISKIPIVTIKKDDTFLPDTDAYKKW